ncbi:MAG: hypothetical protein E7172_04590 [Firmicutes bacterium]|nr:hypothetical protein [Bacillota bacterium]
MKIENEFNYIILTNNLENKILDNFKQYLIIKDVNNFDELIKIISEYNGQRIVFYGLLDQFKFDDQKYIFNLMNLKKIKYINITPDIEKIIQGDYIYVCNGCEVILEGNKEKILQEEKILNQHGFGIPFIVELSSKLKLYNVIDKIYYDVKELVNDLWI